MLSMIGGGGGGGLMLREIKLIGLTAITRVVPVQQEQ